MSFTPDSTAEIRPIFDGSVGPAEAAAVRDALARVEAALSPELRTDLHMVRDYIGRLENDTADLETLYSMTVEASTALENDLSERVEAVTAFVTQTSHELRTPLNAIIGLSELVMEELADAGDKTHDRDLGRIRDSGRHLLALINEILDLSKVEAGQLELCPELFNLEMLVRDVVADAQPLARVNGNKLLIDVRPGVGTIHGDPLRVRQCMLNLLSNACKFTREGAISVRLWRQSDDRLDRVFIAVEDTGIGMSAEELGRIFRPYAQADARTSHKFGGTGLGLAVTRSLCQAMAGDVKADSAPGRGTTFTMRIPARLR